MPSPKPPHVVMLVDNGIEGDSRVQKQARSMIDKGWRVTLVGRRMGKPPKRIRREVGVPVRLVKVPLVAGQRYQVDRSPLWRSPAAFASRRHAVAMEEQARLRVNALALDIRFAKAQGNDNGARKLRSRAKMRMARTGAAVVSFRAARTNAIADDRLNERGRVDRMATRWWQVVKRDMAWTKLDPHLLDLEAAYAPVVDRLKPDLIHANDQRMLLVGARAAQRARIRGRDTKLVWDAHEWVPGLDIRKRRARWHLAQVVVERCFARHADAVVTVSDPLADMLQEAHRLPRKPSVVSNAALVPGAQQPPEDLRTVVGVPMGTPLLVYSGGVNPVRGLDTVVRALSDLPEVHLALVVRSADDRHVRGLLELASELGVQHQVHTAPYVPVEQIVPYVASADIGLAPFHHGPNLEISLPTKFYEYAHAHLPMVVSDVRFMADTTRRTGVGEVFPAGDPAELAAAVRRILDDPEKYRSAFDDEELMASFTWDSQADMLHAVYVETLGREPGPAHSP